MPQRLRSLFGEGGSAGAADMARLAPMRDEWLFLILSLFIGVLSGMLVVCFDVGIDWIKAIAFGSVPHPGEYRLLYMPAIAGLIVAVLVRHVFQGARGSGVNQTKAALYVNNGFISFKTVIGKFITASLAIGAGHSLGPEDPSLQIGAGVASVIARKLKLSKQRLRLFAPIGAAAGLAAAFNAPISAILFVIEEVIGQWSAVVLGSIVLAAFSSAVVERRFMGSEPFFSIPAVNLRSDRELIAYAVLGVFGGIFAVLFSRAIGTLRPWLRSLPRWTQYAQPAVAGLLVGLIGFLGFPQVMGAGYGSIGLAVHGQFAWKFLLALAVFKLIATTLSFSSGTPGGMFAPTLFIGAMLGAGVGSFEKLLFPDLTGTVGSYALVGMGMMFAGFLRCPLTSVFMALEMSGDYSIIVPVIVANTIAYAIARVLQPTPIFEVLTLQDGVELPSMEEQREEVPLRIEDAMQALNVPVARGFDTVAEVCARVAEAQASGLLVQLGGSSWYAMTAEELTAVAETLAPEAIMVRAIKPDRVPVLFPDLPLDNALPYFPRWPLLPVLNRASRGMLEGVITLNGVLKRYQSE